MMQALYGAVFKIIAAAFVCSFLLPLIRRSTAQELLRLLCGVFMTVTLLSGISDISIKDLLEPWQADIKDAHTYTAQGEAEAQKALAACIKSGCEAYVLDKAAELSADITVDICLSDSQIPVPERVSIRGSVSADAKAQLESILTEDMGIPREDQLWSG